MRAARLLHILLILQNRGRQTAGQLASELEVAPRTILRDVDAMTEAGLPVIVHQGFGGGIELGFNYRTRLTGLSDDEAEALGILLSANHRAAQALGLGGAARQAAAKLIESLGDGVRPKVQRAARQFGAPPDAPQPIDARVAALAGAVRRGQIVRLRARSKSPLETHPKGLWLGAQGWVLSCARNGLLPEDSWGDLNISSKRHPAAPPVRKG